MRNRKKKYKVNDILNYLGSPFKVTKTEYSTVYGAPTYDIESIVIDANGNSTKLESVHEVFLKP